MTVSREKIKKIAVESLRDCYVDDLVVASPTHFSDFWARDTFWALSGILKIGDRKSAKENIKLFLKYQREDGKIPRKILREFEVPKYLFGKKIARKVRKAKYTGIVPPFYSMDDNALFIRGIKAYLDISGDEDFIREHYENIQSALLWYERREQNGLLHENFLANWMDTIFKNGKVLYTNVLYIHALQCFSEIASRIGNTHDAREYMQKYKRSKNIFQEKFWNKKFFKDTAEKSFLGKHDNHFDVAGNVLACYFEIASKDQIKSILSILRERAGDGAFIRTVYPYYAFWKVSPITYIMGMPDYHNGASWLWVNLFVIAVEYQYGNKHRAQKNLEDISRVINRDKQVGETYFQDGSLYKKRFWKSAIPFAWSSGVLLEIISFLQAKK